MSVISKESFEAEFLKQETPIKADATVKRKPQKWKGVVITIGFIALATGIVLVIRGILINNPLIFNNAELTKSTNLSFNTPTELNNIKLINDNSQAKTFSARITSPFTPFYNDKLWMALRQTTDTKIGYIDNTGNWTVKYIISYYADLIRLYDDGTILYVINPVNNKNAEFYMQTPGSVPTLINTLNSGQYYTSIYFEPREQLFYYTYFDATSTYSVSAINLSGKVFNIYTSNFLRDKTQIVNIDKDLGYIYFENQSECYYLSLNDKSLNNYNCELIITNNLNSMYWTNSSISNVYSQQIKGEIYKITDDKERRVLYSGVAGEVFTNLTYFNNSLYFVTNKLKRLNNNTWVPEAETIDKIDLNNLSKPRVSIATATPIQTINNILPLNDSLYSVVISGKNTSKLIKYTRAPIVSYIAVPQSYPSSYPTSYATVYNYWIDSSINDISLATPLQSRYTILVK